MRPDLRFAAALGLSGVFALVHFLALPLVMTYDGSDYALLAAGWPGNFPETWHFERTPIYPLALKLGFWVFGPRLGAMAPNVAFAWIGTAALAAAVHRSRPRLALAAVALLTCWPTLIVYQHTVLTEAGSFMVLALLAAWATWHPADVRVKTAALAAGTLAAFLFRPTSLVLVPPALGFLAVGLRPRGWKVAGAHLLAVALVAGAAPVAWSRLAAAGPARGYGGQSVVYGLLKQVVLPPDDPAVAEVRTAYEDAIARSTVDGALDNGGLDRTLHWAPFSSLASHPHPSWLLVHAVTTYPGRFLAGVGRGLLLNLGGPTNNSENEDYGRGVLADAGTGTKLYFPADRLAPLLDAAAFAKPRANGGYGAFIGWFRWPYRLLLWLGALTTLVGFAAGCWLRRADLLALTAIPLYWAVVHAFTLMSSDRFVVPSHAFLVVNAVVVPVLLWVRRWD